MKLAIILLFKLFFLLSIPVSFIYAKEIILNMNRLKGVGIKAFIPFLMVFISFPLFAQIQVESPDPLNDLSSLEKEQCLIQVTTDNFTISRKLKGKRKNA